MTLAVACRLVAGKELTKSLILRTNTFTKPQRFRKRRFLPGNYCRVAVLKTHRFCHPAKMTKAAYTVAYTGSCQDDKKET